MAFSDTWLKANNGKERAALEERSDREGLGVRVTPRGKITFPLRYRYDGKPKRLDLSSYPRISLKDERSRMAAKNRLFLKLCLIYGCRNSELQQAEKPHFDLPRDVWTVPPGNHKLGHATGNPLLRPITPEIAPLIKEAMGSHRCE